MTPEQLVDALFTNGFGEVAERLVLVDANGRDLGGWSRHVVLDRATEFITALQGLADKLRQSELDREGERAFRQQAERTAAELRAERDEAIGVLTAEGLMGGPYGLGLTLADAVRKVAQVARRAAEMRAAAEARATQAEQRVAVKPPFTGIDDGPERSILADEAAPGEGETRC